MVLLLTREGRAPRATHDEAPGHSPRGFGHPVRCSARRDVLRRRRGKGLGTLHAATVARGRPGPRGIIGARNPYGPARWWAAGGGGPVGDVHRPVRRSGAPDAPHP